MARQSQFRNHPTNFVIDVDNANLTKMSFPKFDGTKDHVPWFSRCEQFFNLHKIKDSAQVKLAIYHLEEDSLIWFDMMQEDHLLLNWSQLNKAMNAQFGPSDFDDFYGD